MSLDHTQQNTDIAVFARWQPPDTGQSTALPPLLITSFPRRQLGIICRRHFQPGFPSFTKGSINCITELSGRLGKQVITDHINTLNVGSSPTAPLTNFSLTDCLNQKRTNQIHCGRRLPANLLPTLPKL